MSPGWSKFSYGGSIRKLGLLLAACWVGVPAQAPVQTPSNIQARKVVAAGIAAMGGDLYLQAGDHSGNGRDYTFGSTGDLNSTGVPFWGFYRFPGQARMELGKKRDVIYIYTHDRGWEITYKGVAPMLSSQLKQYANVEQHSLDTILKTWVADPNTLMLYQGLNTFNQAQVDTVSLTTSTGDSAAIDFALSTHLPMRTSWRRDDPQTGGHYEESVTYGAWNQIGGIMTPYSTEHYTGDHKIDSRFFNSVSYAPLPDSLFQPAPLKK